MNSDNTTADKLKIYTVSRLNNLVKYLLSDEFSDIRVTGEISNLSTPSSGHLYFSLKDNTAQIRCAMFRTRIKPLDNTLSNGLQVTARGHVSLYEPRGDYQLVVDSIEAEGAGALRRDFERLKDKLAKEGLFDEKVKLTLPTLPRCIGVITTPTGAAFHDILSVLQRRFPAIPVILYATAVQGANAKFEITKALNTANQRNECDVIILSRGGGALEDLWAFNEEIVARAIYASTIPVISGIGHEIDFTIADFAADLRAATPSAAAESAVPEQRQWLQHCQRLDNLLFQRMQARLNQKKQHAAWLEKRLQQQHPKQQLLRHTQTLDQYELRLQHCIHSRLHTLVNRVNHQQSQLSQQNPETKIQRFYQQHQLVYQRLQHAIKQTLTHTQQKLLSNTQTLHALSPLATLDRGYAIVQKKTSPKIITHSHQLKIDDLLHTRLAQGIIISIVKEIQE